MAWIRFSTMGFEFAVAVGGSALVGYWIDRSYDTGPWGVVVASLLGVLGGMMNLIRQTLSVVREPSHKTKSHGRQD